ncbi:MAG TPA: dihydroorotase, partial [Bacteroidales bacterium]|nr:dihydroorotase [Bacteroidales bacterium]
MAEPLLITGCMLVNEGQVFKGSVLIQQGRIEEIFRDDREIPAGLPAIDAEGDYLLPGVIDDHVHFREPGLTAKGDIHSESRAAVAGGVTSFMDMPNTDPRATTLEILEQKFRIASEHSLANYSFFLGAAADNLAEIEKADPSAICGLKLFMGASTGNMLVEDPEILASIFERSPLLIAVHCEDEATVQKNLEKYRKEFGENIPINAHSWIRDEEACYRASEKAVDLARRFGSRLHLLHISTAKELGLLKDTLPLEQKKITAEVCVHHLWFDEGDYVRLGSLIKWNPSVKTRCDREALLNGLLKDRLDLVATDHAPHTWEEKQRPYEKCPSGGPMIQHSLVAMLELCRQGKLSPEKVVEKMCHAPAILYRIKERGFIRKGYHADLVRVSPDAPWEVNKGNILYKCGWSPLEGVQFS